MNAHQRRTKRLVKFDPLVEYYHARLEAWVNECTIRYWSNRMNRELLAALSGHKGGAIPSR